MGGLGGRVSKGAWGQGDAGNEGAGWQDRPWRAQERGGLPGEEGCYLTFALIGTLWLICGQWPLGPEGRFWESRQGA